jgi:hexosaminidase
MHPRPWRVYTAVFGSVLLLSLYLATSNTFLPERFSTLRQGISSSLRPQIPSTPRARTIELLPIPASYSVGSTVICLDPSFSIHLAGDLDDQATADLLEATARTQSDISRSRHQHLSVHRGEIYRSAGCGHSISHLSLSISTFNQEDASPASIWEGATRPLEDRITWEAYKLDIPTNGTATIQASSAIGLFRGLTSFANSVYFLPDSAIEEGRDRARGATGGYHYLPFGPYSIEDKPAFGWRSVLLETSRHFFSVKAIERVSQAHLIFGEELRSL